MVSELKNEILTLANTLNLEKDKKVWDMEEVFYLDTSIRNKIMVMMNHLSTISGSNESYTVYHQLFTNSEINNIENSLIHNPLPGKRPLAAWEYGYISGSKF